MLNLIGLGLYDEFDLTLRGLEALKKSDRVYFESYTNYFNGDLNSLSQICGKEIIKLTRKDIEEHPEKTLLQPGLEVSLLISGDPLVATTHCDLILRAEKQGIKVNVIHSSSVYSAVGETGLQIYKFGRTITIAYPEGDYFPTSPYEALMDNKKIGLHTLCLLDVKADEDRYMSVNEGVELLLKMDTERKLSQFTNETLCVGVARLGGDTVIKYGMAEQIKREEYGGQPHILIVPAKLHFMEEEMLKRFRV